MPIVIQLPAAGEAGAPDSSGAVELTTDRAGAEQVWRLILALAVRDDAASVCFHSWRTDPLACLVGDRRYVFDPPPADLVRELLPAARALLGAEALPSFDPLAAAGSQGAGAERVRLESPDGSSEWVGVWWSAGGAAGVEFHRLPPAQLTASFWSPSPVGGS
jgi:hypothetical protein